QIGSGTGEDFEKSKDLGTATNIAGTDTYQLAWPVDVADDDYTLRAQIAGTSVVADQEVTVNAVSSMQPGDVPAETIELTRPLLAQQTAFERQTTPVEGIASAGTEGVDIFYTKAAANQTLAEANWINCGFLQLSGEGSTPQPFKATCRLTGADQAVQVTGIAAAPFDCMEPLPGAGCDASADAVPELGRNPGGLESGDAHRIFGYEARPVISLTPPENESSFDDCTKLVLQVTDQTGQVLTGQNVDAHLTGPSDSAHFCNPDDGSATPRRAPDQGGHSAVAGHDDQGAHVADQADTQHTEGETTAQGRFVFGLRGNEGGDSQILVWVDQTDNDVQDTGEPSDSSVMHWIERRTDACTEIGTPGADVLTGTTDADKLCGKGGNDRLLGKGGNDILLGGKGNDRIGGGSGDDNINASRGKDRLSGAKGNDRLKGAAGRDRLNGGAGTDSCQGGPGRDRVRKCEGGGAASARLVRGGVA
ncbi:MAG TPA: calcium-binding protein, partial [Actinomycetota bacterium]